MKNQYFGDIRDLFKYDLVLELLSENNFLDRFLFIPMLTASESSSHGGKTSYDLARAGTQRIELRTFLERCVRENRRNINELKEFFGTCNLGRKIDFAICKPDEYFSHKTRAEYFNEIELELLCKSVILVDPDIGFEVKSMKGREESYVTFSEIKFLFDRMERRSVLMVFQFIPRVRRPEYLSQLGRKMRKVVNSPPVLWVSDNQVAFFVVAKSIPIQKLVTNTISHYGKTHDMITGRS